MTEPINWRWYENGLPAERDPDKLRKRLEDSHTEASRLAGQLGDLKREVASLRGAEELLRQYVDLAAVTHPHGAHGGHDHLGENLTCAGCALAVQAKAWLEAR